MALIILHPAKHATRLFLTTASLLLLAGCQGFTTSSPAHIRVIDLSLGTPAVDVYQGGSALVYNLDYGTVTSYIPTAPGTYILTVDLAGSKQVLSAAKGSFSSGGHYTVLINNSLASLQPVVLTDSAAQLTSSTSSVRLVHQAAHTGAVDVYLVPAGRRLGSVSPIVTNLAPGATTGYLPVPAGVFTAIMLPAGTVPGLSTSPTHTGTRLGYEAGALRSLILVDAPATQPQSLQVIATIDAEPQN